MSRSQALDLGLRTHCKYGEENMDSLGPQVGMVVRILGFHFPSHGSLAVCFVVLFLQ